MPEGSAVPAGTGLGGGPHSPRGAAPSPAAGVFPENLIRFVRLLRQAGARVGPGATLSALRAVEAVGLGPREDFYWALHAVLVTRHDEDEVFRRAFELFWRDPSRAVPELAGLLPKVERPGPDAVKPGQRRVSPTPPPTRRPRSRRPDPLKELDLFLSWSDREVLKTRDFEQMTAEEIELARRAIAAMELHLAPRRTRRWRARRRGARVDPRRTFRASVRSGHGMIPLQRSERRRRPPDLVILCDISGSMDRYARILLHFAHALTSARSGSHTFLFGTRVTNVTHQLRHRDVDRALQGAGTAATDWSGGTRIGASLEAFNRLWSRRVLSRDAVVLLVTDGLDREGGRDIEKEAARLRRSCRRLIWLNPLLRYEGFEPRAAGIRALLGNVDEFRPVHSLESLGELAVALGE